MRLRDGLNAIAESHIPGDNLSVSTSSNDNYLSPIIHSSSSVTSQLSWDYFDEHGYIKRGGLRSGEDPYLRNRFNQQASDMLPSNRDIPDTRNHMCRKIKFNKNLPATSVIVSLNKILYLTNLIFIRQQQ